MDPTLPHRLAAVWFADIVGYGRLASADEDQALRLVRQFQRACRAVVHRHSGRLVKFMGDGALAEFPSTESAVRSACALEAVFQSIAAEATLPAARVHVGVHVGEVAEGPDGDLYGEGVNLAARLQDVAAAGQVLVSGDVLRQLHHRGDFHFEALGERTFQDSETVVGVYRADADLPEGPGGDLTLAERVRALHRELLQRKVYRIASAYVLVAAVGFAALSFALPRTGAPGWTLRLGPFLAVLGLPLVVLLAWTYEINPEGLHRYSGTAGMQETGIRPRSAYILLVAIAGVLAVSTLFLDVPARVEAGPLPANRVAVLYFDDFSPDRSLRHMVDGLTELLIQELSAVPGLEVVSRSGVKPFEDSDVPVDSIARALGAGTLVQGSVAESGDRLRVTVQLIDGGSGTVLARETLERPRGELFALQNDLAHQVARFLRRRLGEEIRLAELRAGTESVAAWELVQRAQQLRESAAPMVAAGGLEEAGRLYDRADSLLAVARAADSTWIMPVVQRGWIAHEKSLWYRFSDFAAFDRWSRTGLDHAVTAARLGGTDPNVLELRGTLRLYRALFAPETGPAAAETQWEEAIRDLRASIEANPDQAGAWSKLAIALAARGRSSEALAAAERAYEADAYLLLDRETLWRLFAMSFDIPLAEEARLYCEEGRRLFPEEPDFHRCGVWLMTIPETEPDPARAWSLHREVDRLAPPQEVGRDKVTQMAVGAVLARAGLRDSALAVAARARSEEAEDPAREMMYFEAFVRTLAGDEEEAVALLAVYLAASPGQRMEAASTWWFDDLHDRADFRALVGRADSAAPE